MRLRLDQHCFLVSVTRGHAYDEEAVAAALRQPCGFVGMIGSRRRVKTTLDRLVEAGIPRERTEDVHAPLGLDIGAETPEEIAVAIIAEIVRERRTGVRDDFTMGVKSGRLKPNPVAVPWRMSTGFCWPPANRAGWAILNHYLKLAMRPSSRIWPPRCSRWLRG